MSEDNFFAMPAAEEAPLAEAPEGDFTMVGEAPPAEEESADMGFAGGAAPEEMDAFAAPPVEEEATPIILAPAPEEEEEIPVETEPMVPAAPMDPSAMQKWNEEWQVTLNQRKEEEETVKLELEAAAKAFLEEFQADKEAKRESKMAKNREDEQAKLEAIEADLENDNSWQRVCKMVELSHDGGAGEDVKKMRDALILLKNDAARASAVGA